MGALTEMMTAGLVAAEDSHGGAIAFPILTMLILVPIVGAVAVAISSKRRPEIAKLIAFTVAIEFNGGSSE